MSRWWLGFAIALSASACALLENLSDLGTLQDGGIDAADAESSSDASSDAHDAAPIPVDPNCAAYEAGSPHCFGKTCTAQQGCCLSPGDASCGTGCTGCDLHCTAASDCSSGLPVCCLSTDVPDNFDFDASTCPIAIASVNGSIAECLSRTTCSSNSHPSLELCGGDGDCDVGKHCEQATLFGRILGVCVPTP